MSAVAGGEPGGWGPVHVGGRRARLWWRLAAVVSTLAIASVVAYGAAGLVLLRRAESSLTRVPVSELQTRDPGGQLNVLVAGSDARGGLSAEERRRLSLGTFEGQRSDTVILVSIMPEQGNVNVVSFPRDLAVIDDDGRLLKLTDSFAGGPDALVDIVQDNFDIPVHHYVEVSINGFISVVEALGSVELCLDDPLMDDKSGADFTAGCHDMSPEEALSYVRSRQGARGDFERIERQQQFMKAMLEEMVDARILVDLPRLFRVVEQAARTVTTDEDLSVNRMRKLAEELRGLADGRVPMTFVPGYTQTVNGGSFVLPYGPGARDLFDALVAGELLAPRGDEPDRAEVAVALWTGDRPGAAGIVESTLNWSAFQPYPAGRGPVDAGAVTTVFRLPGHEQEAAWVAATLGTLLRDLPPDITPPEDADVVVAVGDDGVSSAGLPALEQLLAD